ncbi:TonB-dependent receptor [Arenibacter palladensis]|uniref:TonB-dependent receptor n=1 Tax=Arenibacter palladensis TaxID=237373 RepID=UPI0026E269AB|nr:TonB-dependent receptor [Arenibacter palladensis]MDO6602828.1 TonB-dependent receptor [Arenibacter palladensis]
MKLTVLLTIAALFQIQANTYSQNKKISLDFSNATMETVIHEIEVLSEFKFLLNRNDVDLNKKVSIKVIKQKIEIILSQLFSNTNVDYEILNKQIVLRKRKLKVHPSPKVVVHEPSNESIQFQISGTITDQDGTPLPGANILEKGTTNGTQTDFDGNFLIRVSNEYAILQFSYLGFTTKEVNLAGETSLSIILEEKAAGLAEVVVVGYGSTKKVNLTGAISTIKFDESINNRPITNASQALGGGVTGVWVSQNSGQPGNDGAQLRVRGWGTLNNSNPLVIIDGIEGDFNQLNPNDIASITVLKDAASAAIYGSKAANGVILVTTIKGDDEKMEVAISSYLGFQSLGKRYALIDNSAEYMELWNQGLKNEGVSPLYSDQLISAFRNGNDPYVYPNSNPYNELFNNASILEHNISVKGGSSKLSSYLSFNYLKQEGIVRNTGSGRYGIRANLESNLNGWLTIGGRFNYIKKNIEEPYNLVRVWEMLEEQAPFIAPYDRLGRYGSVQAIDESGNLLYDNRNPLIDAANGQNDSEQHFISATGYANLKFTDYLSLNTTFASTNVFSMVDKYNESIFGYTDSGLETITRNYNSNGLEISRSQITSSETNIFSTLNFDINFADSHDVSVVAGIQFQEEVNKNVYARRANPPKEGMDQVDAGTSGIQGEGNMIGVKTLSYFGRLKYSLLDRYLFEANLRADGSSRFAKANRWGVFPGFSLGWRLSEEAFLQESKLVSNLKLRASWGQLGNQNIGESWPYLTTISQSNDLSYNLGGGFTPGAAVTALVDEDISWETSSSLDFGADIGLFNNQLNIEVDYFNKTTSNIIVQLPIPLSLGGLDAPYENVGEVLNSGFEMNINYDNRQLDWNRVGYQIGLNMTTITNEVSKFKGGDSPDQLYLIREGYSFQSLYGYKMEGIYQTDQEAIDHLPNNGFMPKAGNIRYIDLNNDGRLGYEDKEDIGNTIPKFTYGISSKLKYKGFDFNLLFQGALGIHAYTKNEFTQPFNISGGTVTERWRNAWTMENGNNSLPSIKHNNAWDLQDSSFWVSDISFFKLKNVQLGYTLPERFISRLGFGQVYLYGNVQNVFTLVNNDYEGYDPERSTFNSGNRMYPTPRIISLGINLKF